MQDKACVRCKATKPTTDFSKESRRKDGLSLYCKECCSEKYEAQFERASASFANTAGAIEGWQDITELPTKVCRKCGTPRPRSAEFFPIDKRGKDGLMAQCRRCRSEYQKARRQLPEMKEYHRVASAQWYENNREQVNGHRRISEKELEMAYKNAIFLAYGGKCYCCGEDDIRFLTIDHINNDGKQHREEVGVGRTMTRWIIRNGFPDNIRLACYGCNMARAHAGNNGICPHEQDRLRDLAEIS